MKPITVLLIIVILCLIPSGVYANPGTPLLPCEFYGNITINGNPAPPGTVITALINGEERGTLTTISEGSYGSSTGMFEPRLIVSGFEGEQDQTIRFIINGFWAHETAQFTTGGIGDLNLTVILSGPPPVSRFTQNITSGMAPITVLFTDTSDCHNPTGRSWDFGDGTTIPMVQNPLHTYAIAGIYIVRLTVINSTGSNTTGTGTPITVFPRGDFNRNWRVDIGDVTSVAYMAAGLIPKDPNANFKGYGVVDIADASKIAWYYVGKIAGL